MGNNKKKNNNGPKAAESKKAKKKDPGDLAVAQWEEIKRAHYLVEHTTYRVVEKMVENFRKAIGK